jgi:hypothetical protein
MSQTKSPPSLDGADGPGERHRRDAFDGRQNSHPDHVRAAFSLGTLIPLGGISVSEVEAVLTSAALKAGLHPHEIATTLDSGLGAGMNEPRPVGAPG